MERIYSWSKQENLLGKTVLNLIIATGIISYYVSSDTKGSRCENCTHSLSFLHPKAFFSDMHSHAHDKHTIFLCHVGSNVSSTLWRHWLKLDIFVLFDVGLWYKLHCN